jgi:hypothetical protein
MVRRSVPASNKWGRPAVTQGVRGDTFMDTGPTRRVATCDPDGFVGNRLLERPAASPCREHV